MSQRRSRIRLVLLATLAVLVVALAVLHLSYPLPYVYSVLVDQGPDFDDIHQFPASSIAASRSPEELTVAVEPRVAEVLEQHPDVVKLGALLDETETLRPGSEEARRNRITRARLRLVLGTMLANQDAHRLAAREFTTALDLDPTLEDAGLLLGRALIRLGDHDQAATAYSRVLDVNPDNTHALLKRAEARLHVRKRRRMTRQVRFLRQIADCCARLDEARSAIRLYQPSDDL